MAQAFLSQRVVTPSGTHPAAVLVEQGRIVELCAPGEIPTNSEIVDLSEYALLPGLVDAHTHINEPGRTEWEGFETATRAAAAGGFTTLVDMPLNNLPATTTVENLCLKQNAASGKCMVDYGFWGGAVADNSEHIAPLASAGVLGYKCFLVHPGIDGFTMVNRA